MVGWEKSLIKAFLGGESFKGNDHHSTKHMNPYSAVADMIYAMFGFRSLTHVDKML